MIFGEKRFDIVSETERIVIRPLRNADYKNWLSGCESRLPSQHRYDEGKLELERTEEWFSNFVKTHQELAIDDIAYIFGVFHKKDGSHLGIIDFSTLERDDFQWGRIGYNIHNQYWNRGYGKEAVKEALKVGFNHLKFHRIEAHINVDNTASCRLAECVGMEYECTRKGFIFEFEEWTDNLIYYKNSSIRQKSDGFENYK